MISTIVLLVASQDKPRLVEALESMARRSAEAAAESVVSIRVEREEEKAPAPPPRGRRRGSRPGPFEHRPAGGAASGTVIDAGGLILTSQFNVDGNVKKITVVLADGRSMEAQLLGYHRPLDLALLRVPAEGLKAIPRAEGPLFVGQPVYALGRAPEGGGLTLSPGIVSGTGRFAGRAVQHDGEANFGNAGGPLVDAHGRLVGLTCRVSTRYAGAWGQNSGIAFAAPCSRILEALEPMRAGAKVEAEKKAYVGVQSDRASESGGCALQAVLPGTPAQKAGLLSGDVIVEFGGVPIESYADFTREVGNHKPGEKVTVKVRRKDEEKEFEIQLGEREVE
jgi:S1-C subfamily serine protease